MVFTPFYTHITGNSSSALLGSDASELVISVTALAALESGDFYF